jgi:hypothetical protein
MVDLPQTDRELRTLTIARLSDPRHAQAVANALAQVSDRLATLEAEIREIEQNRSLAQKPGVFSRSNGDREQGDLELSI